VSRHNESRDEAIKDEYKCLSCGELCKLVEETFDYAGTHCTNGNSGTHKTGHYLTDCCLADYEVK